MTGKQSQTTASLRGILETSLYVADLEASAHFYRSLFGFEELVRDDHLCALGISGKQILLLFLKGASVDPRGVSDGRIPPHDAKGELHLAFAVGTDDLPLWENRLKESGIPIESHVEWDRGGQSIYFRDPDNHSIELATPGTWSIY